MLIELVAPQRVEFDPSAHPGKLVIEMCHAPEQVPVVVSQGRYKDDEDAPIRPFKVGQPDKDGLVRSTYILHAHPDTVGALQDITTFDISCEIVGLRTDWLIQVFRDRQGADSWVALVLQSDYSIACRLPGYDPLDRMAVSPNGGSSDLSQN